MTETHRQRSPRRRGWSQPRLPRFAYTVYAGGHGFTSTFNCTVGFAAKDAYDNRYMLTAQHCVAVNDPVLVFGQLFGWRWYNSPAYDTATIRNWFPATLDQLPRVWTWNGSYVTIKGSYTTLQYSYACKSGMTTGWTCGYVTATGLAMWASQSGMYVYNLTRARLCAGNGDSGGPVVATAGVYWYATGILEGGNLSGTCTATTNSYYVPIAAALSHTGLSLVTG